MTGEKSRRTQAIKNVRVQIALSYANICSSVRGAVVPLRSELLRDRTGTESRCSPQRRFAPLLRYAPAPCSPQRRFAPLLRYAPAPSFPTPTPTAVASAWGAVGDRSGARALWMRIKTVVA